MNGNVNLFFIKIKLVSPVAGTVRISGRSNEITITNSDDLPEGSELTITNLRLSDQVQHMTQVYL
jgi:hypothetical protein